MTSHRDPKDPETAKGGIITTTKPSQRGPRYVRPEDVGPTAEAMTRPEVLALCRAHKRGVLSAEAYARRAESLRASEEELDAACDVIDDQDRTAARDRSYQVRRFIPEGARVRLKAPITHYFDIPAGTTGTLGSYSNAGSRGIEATIALSEPLVGVDGNGEERTLTRLRGVSAGLLERVFTGSTVDAADRAGWRFGVDGRPADV